jgi:hypothetical protein
MEHIREVTEIELHHDNMNREEGFSLRKSQKPLVDTLKECKEALSNEKGLI